MSQASQRNRPADEEVVPTLFATTMREGRVAIARSHRLHRLRGGFCARGYCQQCPVRTGAGEALACELPPGPIPSVAVDPLRPLGMAAERMTPWFYERRFRRPRALRQAYLRSLRAMSVAAVLPEEPAERGPADAEDLATDVLVVGGGPSGIAAAARIADAGAFVTIVTRGTLGGSAPVDASHSSAIERDLETLGLRGARLMPGSLCLGLYEQEDLAAVLGPSGPFTVRFERLVVATGAYDRLPLVPGNDLPGVVGLRAFERLAAHDAFARGTRVGVVGAPGELIRARAASERFSVPVSWSTAPEEGGDALVRIEGRRRVRSARLASGGRHQCDVLVVGMTQPMFELLVHAGRRARVEGAPPIVRARGPARMPLLVVGEAAGHVDPDEAIAGARRDGAAWVDGGSPVGADEPAIASFAPSGPPDPDAFVCLCEDVRVRDIVRCVADGFDDLELIKRRTGATTGPCQGKLCLGLLCEAAASVGVEASIPTMRPPLRPVRIASLGGDG